MSQSAEHELPRTSPGRLQLQQMQTPQFHTPRHRQRTLYLIETRAKHQYNCSACQQIIARGTLHFRHDPHPYSRVYRGHKTSYWCKDCILAATSNPKDSITGRLRVPALAVVSHNGITGGQELEPFRVELIGVGRILAEQIAKDIHLLHSLTPEQFETLICDRIFAMGFEPKRTGALNRKDGGIDLLFWPRARVPIPFLGAAQIKHHRNPDQKEGVSTVRDFSGAILGHPFNAGLIVTNTTFSPDAEWFARERAKLIRLRGFDDIRRWVYGNFCDEAEWREIPPTIELCPGVVIRIR
jgi:hypothetical protein